MQIIGEKINGTRKRVAQAIAERDQAAIQSLALKQSDAGAAWLDVNAGTHPNREADDLAWLIETIQAVCETPLCLDSANPQALRQVIPITRKTPMINSISGESERLEGILPLAAQFGCPVIALAMDGKQIPPTADERMAVIEAIFEATRAAGLPDERVYVDPLAMTLSTRQDSAVIALETLRLVRQRYPQAHTTIGLSNISYGLPARGYINRYFLALAMAAGLDSAIIDPLDREMRAALITTELLLGRDRHCLGYMRAFRAGLFGGEGN